MEKKDINHFADHGDFISINYDPYYKASTLVRYFLLGIFIGGTAAAVITFSLIKFLS